MIIIGYRDTGFTAKSGDFVDGRVFYFTQDIDSKRGAGVSADKIFVCAEKLSKVSYLPCIGDDVEIIYNKYGKFADFRPC